MSSNRLLTLCNHIRQSPFVRMKALNTCSTLSLRCQQSLFNGGRLMSTNIKNEVIDDSGLSSQSPEFSFEVPEIPTINQIDTGLDTGIDTGIIAENVLKASDIGLSPFMPTRAVFDSLTSLHDAFDLTWFSTIATVAIIFRVALFPMVINHQRHTQKVLEKGMDVSKHMEKIQSLQKEGNFLEAQAAFQKYTNESMELSKNSFKTLGMPLVQGFFVSSYILAMKEMSKYPLPSIQNESFYWIDSLTQVDPFYILPTGCALAVFLNMRQQSAQKEMPIWLKSMPYVAFTVIFGFSSFFPASVSLFFLVNNSISLLQGTILKQEAVRNYLDLPKLNMMKMHVASNKHASFSQGFNSSMEYMKMANELQERERFQKSKNLDSKIRNKKSL